MRVKIAVLGMILVMAFSATSMAEEDYKKHPGYVDFETMGIFGKVESTVEVFLKGPLLSLVSAATEEEDPELSDAISKLKYIHIQAFPLEDVDVSKVAGKIKDVAKQLEQKGWETVVRMRDDEENVHVYLLPTKSGEEINGLVVMVIEEDNEAVFINIVGEIDPKQIGRLGRKFDIKTLENIQRDMDEDDDD
ncbi:MAG: DUF4252 domain-containing protein [Candidatus Latescibacteria bacterium]|nr:DUF4252 domain-containing protein [Candidatus Latescibacterota bacterium]NIO00969.1 DUF4252 domain-containing protein [Candidatus Latescibacterota bacterium]NIO27368.1 DUF4252 domain-containing protein [Candidatus Latescibacterota bacterium]NIO54890.1 DUF4252 domain-containing protein [Candidatus Latescibacterota bacterium]NIT00979.1 DUF4252 domain-containing protein [Candidatus Latescibacterota bacterium]